MSELIWALKNGDLEQVRKIVEGKDVNLNDEIEGGRQPILIAADFGHAEVLEYVISKGADVNAQDKHGITPILASIWEGHVSCVKLLLAHGASTDGSAPDGKSYLEAAENEEIRNLLR